MKSLNTVKFSLVFICSLQILAAENQRREYLENKKKELFETYLSTKSSSTYQAKKKKQAKKTKKAMKAKDLQASDFSETAFRDFAIEVANFVDTTKPDMWIDNKRELHRELRKTESKSIGEGNGWLALTPGDVIYYKGATGVYLYEHSAIYLGLGCTIELWKANSGEKSSSSKGVVVLNTIENFKTSAKEIKLLCCGSCCKKRYLEIGKIKEDDIKSLYGVKKLKTREKILQEAGASIVGFSDSLDYSPLNNNCQTFVMDILTTKKTHTYQITRLRNYAYNTIKGIGVLAGVWWSVCTLM